MLNVPEAQFPCRKVFVGQKLQQNGLRIDGFPPQRTFAPLGQCLSKVAASSVSEMLGNEDSCKQINSEMLSIWLSMQDATFQQDDVRETVAQSRPEQMVLAPKDEPFIKQEPM